MQFARPQPNSHIASGDCWQRGNDHQSSRRLVDVYRDRLQAHDCGGTGGLRCHLFTCRLRFVHDQLYVYAGCLRVCPAASPSQRAEAALLVTSPRVHGGSHGVEPSPRRPGPTWSQFVGAHAATMPAGDFLDVDTVLLRRLYVPFSIGLDTRRVHMSGITANPVRGWVIQPARNLSFALGGKGRPTKFLIRDRGAKFTASFDEAVPLQGHPDHQNADPVPSCQRVSPERVERAIP